MTMIWMTCWERIEMARLKEERRRSGVVGGIWVLRKRRRERYTAHDSKAQSSIHEPGSMSIHPSSQPASLCN